MWLAASCATLLWLDTARVRYLLVASAALAWGFEARPLTMIALAAPLIFVIVRRAVHTRRCRPLVGPVLIAMLVLAVGPLWNRQTLGAWLSDPYPYYSKVYFPFDKPGFGVDTTPPLRQVPRELAGMDAWSSDVHRCSAFGRAVRAHSTHSGRVDHVRRRLADRTRAPAVRLVRTVHQRHPLRHRRVRMSLCGLSGVRTAAGVGR